ncbi:dihydrofolate reductase family protein [Marinigracilibium pacificum]|uniref:Dihydrofolate reductase n=1 Tax=Marinigracilibium pacificum TaxID=2729599 RepID=A0A848IVV1_9BACT|nr:dihydrofolate reductase family protein [Marinigracilibium pacificum]NMM47816.1 dihydrofolate reductase [Marinigracilibium pacificum]
MRKIILQEFISLDGIIQSPGAPEEDSSNGFQSGGWVTPFFKNADSKTHEFMQKNLIMTDLLLGRKTYEIFAEYWPDHADSWPGINDANKYVVSNSDIPLNWKNSVLITGDVISKIQKLKSEKGSNLKVFGSSKLVQTLLNSDLVDKLCLMTIPVILGNGKRLFHESDSPSTFKLTDSFVSSTGLIFSIYDKIDNKIETGTIGS